MKKYLFPLVASLNLAVGTHAALILEEPFTYPDGTLTNAPGSIWTLHSSSGAHVGPFATNGTAYLSQTNTPDVNASLTGPSTPTVYASFTVNFSAVPNGSGGAYFAHFKDATVSGFRCRVFAATNNAAPDKFRLGILNGLSSGTPVFVPTDLDLNTDYLVVVRYFTNTVASTLWINPNSEASLANRADATDSVGALPVTSFGLRQAGQNPGIGVLRLDNLKVGTAFADVSSGGNPALNPPFVSSISNQSIAMNSITPAISFYVTDGETAPASLTLSAASSNPALVPVNNVVFDPVVPADSNRTVTITSAAGQQGFSEITVTAKDGDMNTANRKFLVIVGAPTISPVANVTTARNTATPAIAFTVGDGEGDPLTVSALSTNENVVPVSGIVFGGSGANRTVTITPAPDTNGLSRITLVVSDGFNTASNSFVVTVYPTLHVVLCDGFDYSDGALVNVSSIWGTHSGTPQEVLVSGGRILLSGANGEDVSAAFTNPPSFTAVSFPPHEGWIVYSSFTVNFSSRPATANGDYFAHFRNAGTGTSFGGKVFATTNGAAVGKLRLGISNNANAPANAVLPVDLDLGVDYTVVTRYAVGTGQSKLWINPTSETDPGAVPTDGGISFIVETYAFREPGGGNATGNMSIDDLKVGTTFADVVTVGPNLTISAVGNNVTISWPASATDFVLRYTDSFPANWQDFGDQGTVQGDMKVVTLNGVTGNRFFELRKP